MNFPPSLPSACRRHFLVGSLMLLAVGPRPVQAADVDLSKFKRIEPQYIAALADAGATSGKNAEAWGLWVLDPGPRGRPLDNFQDEGAQSPWKFDAADWWLEEHGLVMEKPSFPLPPGKYLVTGGRKVTSVLTVQPKDKNGHQRWELADGATLHDVTHLGCRAVRYKPAKANASCTPAKVRTKGPLVNPGESMPVVSGCQGQEYLVLIVVGLPAAHH